MKKIDNLNDALKRIDELEQEVADLKDQLAHITPAGRKKHDKAWMASYNDFAVKYAGGMTMVEIVECSDFSRRTAYRYKSYYDEINGKPGSKAK